MRKIVGLCLAAFVSLYAGAALAQDCNTPSGFVRLVGEWSLGDTLVLGPDCNSAQSGGPSSITTGIAGFAYTGNGVGVGATFQGFVAFNANSFRTWNAKARDTFSILDYAAETGCIANSVSDCAPAINAAIQAAYDYTVNNGSIGVAAEVYLPAGPSCYRINSTINLLKNISIRGDGRGSCIRVEDSDGITLNYVSGYGQPTISDLYIVGIPAHATAPRTGIKVAGSLSDWGQILYGTTVRNSLVTGFDTGFSAQSAISIWITNSWIQDVNRCIVIIGWSGILKTTGSECQYADGGGTGTTATVGIQTLPFFYSTGPSGAATLVPEGIEMLQTSILNFKTGVDIQGAGFVTYTNGDISATVDGFKFTNVYGGLVVQNNYIALISATALHGIYGVGTSISSGAVPVIANNTLISTSSTISTGIQINDPAAFGITNPQISKNLLSGFGVRDILVNGPNQANVEDNWANSVGTVDSINLGAASSGTSIITNNKTAGAIVANASDLATCVVRKSNNVVAGVREAANCIVETNSTTANRLMLGSGTGSQPTALAAGTTSTVLHGNAAGAPSYGPIASADMAITATSCTAQFVSAISTGGIGTCTTPSLTGAQFASQGTATTVLHGNAGGNLSFSQVAIATDVSGLPAGILSWLLVPSSANLFTALTTKTGTGGNVVFASGSPTVVPDGSDFTVGPGGSGALNGLLSLSGSSGAGQGAMLRWLKNGAAKWYLAHVSAIDGVGTSDDLVFFNTFSSNKTMRFSVTDDAIYFLKDVSTGVTTVASLPVCNAARKASRFFVNDNATALAFAAVVTAGGAIQTPVYCDGAVWRQG